MSHRWSRVHRHEIGYAKNQVEERVTNVEGVGTDLQGNQRQKSEREL